MAIIVLHKLEERWKEKFPRGKWKVTSNSHICRKYFIVYRNGTVAYR